MAAAAWHQTIYCDVLLAAHTEPIPHWTAVRIGEATSLPLLQVFLLQYIPVERARAACRSMKRVLLQIASTGLSWPAAWLTITAASHAMSIEFVLLVQVVVAQHLAQAKT